MEDVFMYRTVNTKFWRDKKIKGLDPISKLLFLYFFTNDHTHVAGLYYLPMPVIPHETGLTEKQISKATKVLKDKGLAYHDPDSESVLVVNMLEYQGNGGPKIKAAVNKQLEVMGDSPLLEIFIAKHESGEIGYRKGIHTHTVPVPVSDINNIKISRLVELYHEHAPSMAKCQGVKGKRLEVTKGRLNDYHDKEEQFWIDFFKKVEASDFLCQRTSDGGLKASDFTWIMRPTNFISILEGKYDNRGNKFKDPTKLTFDEMMAQISASGGSTDDYEAVYPDGGGTPVWVKK